MREKMSKQHPPAPTASTIGHCPTVIQVSRTPRHWKFTQHLRTTRPPPLGIPMGTNCAPLVVDLFLFYYERDFMLSLSEDNQSDVIEAFNSTSGYLADLLNIYNNFFDSMVNRIYPSELQLNKANMSVTKA